MDEKMNTMDIKELIDINDLSYIAENSSNLIVQRNQKKYFADSSEASTKDRNIVVNIQSGNDFVSFKDSYMRLKVKVLDSQATPVAIAADWGGQGTVLNLFDTIKVISRGGTELSHNSRANLLNYYKVLYGKKFQWRTEQQGKALLGWGTPLAAGENEYLIPLSILNSFFDQQQLTPNNVCRGLRLEITLSDKISEILTFAGTAPDVSQIVVTGVELLLDSYRIDPRAQTILNEMSASDTGLVLQYFDYEHTNKKTSNETNVSIEMRKTAAMANGCFATLRSIKTEANEIKADSFATEVPTDDYEYQWRLGSTYFPVNKLVGLKQWYAQNNYCMDKLRTGEEMGMTFQEYKTNTTNAPAVSGSAATACVNIDRYFLNMSGLAINNSTSLSLLLDLPTGLSLNVDMFLKYSARCVAFLETIEVKK